MQYSQTPFLNLQDIFFMIYQSVNFAVGAIFSFFTGPGWAEVEAYFIVLEVFLIFGLALISYRFIALRRSERQNYYNLFKIALEPEKENRQWWQDILDHLASDNSAQWTLAVIDADKILEDALRDAGFVGVGVGEMLKDAEAKHGFRTLQDAWEAHKVRNKIAHETGFELSKRDAKNAVERYQIVFAELGYL